MNTRPMSQLGQKRKWARFNGMSALAPIADIVRPPQHVRKCQERTISRYQRHVRFASADRYLLYQAMRRGGSILRGSVTENFLRKPDISHSESRRRIEPPPQTFIPISSSSASLRRTLVPTCRTLRLKNILPDLCKCVFQIAGRQFQNVSGAGLFFKRYADTISVDPSQLATAKRWLAARRQHKKEF
jgi:hypothetical protein